MEVSMKILVAAGLLAATLSASPALAQYPWQPAGLGYRSCCYGAGFAYRPVAYRARHRAYARVPRRAYARAPYRAYGRAPYRAYGAYALAPGLAFARPLVPRPFSVYNTQSNYVGSDPDPRVRDQLARDPSQAD
jgi:hypothetical protein